MATDLQRLAELIQSLPADERQRLQEILTSSAAAPSASNDAITTSQTSAGDKQKTLFERLQQAGLIGCIEGGSADLSTNPAHMDGFGES